MKQLLENFPIEFNNYIEPFFGGGSVLFELQLQKKIRDDTHVFISDINDTLMNIYSIIKEYPNELIVELKKEDIYKNNKTNFIDNRTEFNKLKKNNIQDLNKQERVKLASLYIYLNRVCFNGMYRENKKGEYNIPFGKQKNPIICNEELINELSEFFNNSRITLKTSSYNYIEEIAKKGDFIYLDPPYYDTFTDYNKTGFNKESQINLMECYKRLTEKGCKIALSNSNSEFIRTIYNNIANVRIIEIDVKRVINSKSENRKKQLKELLIVNY